MSVPIFRITAVLYCVIVAEPLSVTPVSPAIVKSPAPLFITFNSVLSVGKGTSAFAGMVNVSAEPLLAITTRPSSVRVNV